MNKKKCIFFYLIGSAFLFVFQFVYHQYSHGVISKEMQLAWTFPLIVFVVLMVLSIVINVWSHRLALNLIHSGLVTLVAKVILSGILDIAGSDSPYLFLYSYVGIGMLVIGFLLLFTPIKKRVPTTR